MKADYLVNRFGENGFSYIGDATADLTVWKSFIESHCRKCAIKLAEKIEALGKPHHYIDAAESLLDKYFQSALRLHQWLKNILVFLPMLASHK